MKHNAHGYWLEEAGPLTPAPPLSGERDADIVVLGGGYTGMWAAWLTKAMEPQARVVLLEADVCARGPSGRNGGFCNEMWFSLANMRQRWGDEAALAVARAGDDAVAGVGAFCAEQGVDAWFHRGGYLQVSAAPAQDDVWNDAAEACRALGAADAVRLLSPDEVAAHCASPAFRGGAFYPGAATVQPARLALGLRQQLLAAGVEIHEHSPARGLRDIPGGIKMHTDSGSVRAGAAIVAIGGAARARRGPLHNRLTITSSHIVLTEPVPDLLEEVGWTGGECITDCRTMLHYFRTTPDGRIAFGLGGGRISPGGRLHGRVEVDPEVIARAAERLRAYFPGIAGRRLTHAWGGPIDVSPTHLPLVMPFAADRAFAAAGYTGNGVGPSHMVGQTLASLALGRRDAHSRLPFIDPSPQRVPPEPFHWLGGSAIHAGIMSKEQAESEGRKPHPASAALARIPKLIGFHIGR
ncbi:MAG TPA: FAD-dependent oxidoreductase [Solirubrobacterales bacterium]|jgi:glycine/D-amino acid oxidase-like deaminating enzyme|nr:FAD-dependent oxidoreductase [Solirubrobacterales bacterium]